jgi:g-D-glutamyl-meso-diaminopimelate peptidase
MSRLHPSLSLTLHTQGEEIYYRKTDPPVRGAAEIAATLAALTGYRLADPEGMAAYGGMSDYVAEEYRLPAFTLECGLGKNPLPMRDAPAIYLRLRRALFLSLGLGAR